MLVVIVVARAAMVALRWASVASLLSISARGSATVALATLSAEARLGAISGVLWLRSAMLTLAVASLTLMWWSAAVLAWRRRGVAVVTWLSAVLGARVVGGRWCGAGVGSAGRRGRVVAVAVVTGRLVVLCMISPRVLGAAKTSVYSPSLLPLRFPAARQYRRPTTHVPSCYRAAVVRMSLHDSAFHHLAATPQAGPRGCLSHHHRVRCCCRGSAFRRRAASRRVGRRGCLSRRRHGHCSACCRP